MADIYSLSKARRREPSERFKLPESWLLVADTLGLPVAAKFSAYCLQRTRRGTVVFLREGAFTMNASYFLGVTPSNHAEARKWVSAIAERFGWELTEERLRC